MVLQSGNGEAEGRWLLRMQEYKPGYRGGRQSLGTMKQVEEQESVRVEQEDLRTWDQEAQVPWSLGPSSLQDSYSEAKGLGKGLPFRCRWARPREVSSPLVKARSGWLLLAASLLVSSPRRLSEPQACRAQGAAASHSPRAGQ